MQYIVHMDDLLNNWYFFLQISRNALSIQKLNSFRSFPTHTILHHKNTLFYTFGMISYLIIFNISILIILPIISWNPEGKKYVSFISKHLITSAICNSSFSQLRLKLKRVQAGFASFCFTSFYSFVTLRRKSVLIQK